MNKNNENDYVAFTRNKEEKEQKTYSDHSQITGGGSGMSGTGSYRSYGKEGNQSVCAYFERACRIIILGGFIYVKGRCD